MRFFVNVIVAASIFAACGRDDEASSSSVAADTATLADTVSGRKGRILFVGTSLTAGLGLDPEQSYPALIAHRIDSLGLPYEVDNAGYSGETSAGALRRIDWLVRNPVDVLVLETGANDGLRGLSVDSMRANIQAIIDRVRAASPNVRILLVGMEAPPNLGPRYTSEFRKVFPEVAERNGATLLPFLLVGVAGVDSLNQGDGIHPNVAGSRRLAETVWPALLPMLQPSRGLLRLLWSGANPWLKPLKRISLKAVQTRAPVRAPCISRVAIMALPATQIRRGMVIVFENDPCRIIEFRHHTPGNLRAMVQAKLKNLRTGNSFEHRFRAADQVHQASMETHELEFMYQGGDTYHFMNTETYDQIELDAESLGDNAQWLAPGMRIQAEYYNGKPIGIQLPNSMELTIVDTSPVMKSATKTASFKPAKLENGATVNIPEFIPSGVRIRVNPNTGEYLDRAK